MVDMWAFGCTFYEVLHIKPMFSGSQFIVINRIANADVSEFEVDCPENFRKAIMQCFEARPANRPDALEFIETVEGVKFQIELSMSLSSSLSSSFDQYGNFAIARIYFFLVKMKTSNQLTEPSQNKLYDPCRRD